MYVKTAGCGYEVYAKDLYFYFAGLALNLLRFMKQDSKHAGTRLTKIKHA